MASLKPLAALAFATLLIGAAMLAPAPAKAWWGPRWGVSVGVAVPPVVVVPPPVYVPPPVVYAPPPPPVVAYTPRRPVWIPGHWHGHYWVPGHWG